MVNVKPCIIKLNLILLIKINKIKLQAEIDQRILGMIQNQTFLYIFKTNESQTSSDSTVLDENIYQRVKNLSKSSNNFMQVTTENFKRLESAMQSNKEEAKEDSMRIESAMQSNKEETTEKLMRIESAIERLISQSNKKFN